METKQENANVRVWVSDIQWDTQDPQDLIKLPAQIGITIPQEQATHDGIKTFLTARFGKPALDFRFAVMNGGNGN